LNSVESLTREIESLVDVFTIKIKINNTLCEAIF
jgi:hypothetical protein